MNNKFLSQRSDLNMTELARFYEKREFLARELMLRGFWANTAEKQEALIPIFRQLHNVCRRQAVLSAEDNARIKRSPFETAQVLCRNVYPTRRAYRIILRLAGELRAPMQRKGR